MDGRGTQCRSCPRTAGRIPIRTRAATELEPRDFDLSAHAGEHRSLIGCYSGHRRQSEKRRADRAAVVLLPSNHACNQSVLPAAVAKAALSVRAPRAISAHTQSSACERIRTPNTPWQVSHG